MEKNKFCWQDLTLFSPSIDYKNVKACEQSFVVDLYRQGPWFFLLPEMNRALFDLKKNLLQEEVESKVHVPTVSEFSEITAVAAIPKVLPQRPTREWSDYLEAVKQCKICSKSECAGTVRRIHGYNKQTVDKTIKVLFLADYPSGLVDEGGGVIAGEKGILLSRMALAMGLSKEDYEVSFLLKCPPADEMNEEKVEVMASNCQGNLVQEICYLKPRVIITMGALAMLSLLDLKEKLSNIHGQFFKKNFLLSKEFHHECVLVPIFNLDYIQLSTEMKKIVWRDLQKVISYLQK